jgi:hypothetical protein
MGTDLIADYLDALRVRLGGRRDVEDLVAEAADHLLEVVERNERDGCTLDEATRRAIESFGEPHVVARAYLSTPAGVAVPTESTRVAGVLAFVVAGLWIAVVSLWAIATLVEDEGGAAAPGVLLYFAGVLALTGASGLTAAVVIALRERHGHALGPLGVVGLGTVLTGAISTLGVAWAVPVWMSLLAVGTALVAVAMWRRPIAPRLPTVLLAVSLPIGVATFAVTSLLEIGGTDRHGDVPAALFSGLAVGCGLSAVAMVAIGRWLRGEAVYPELRRR